MIVTYLPFKKYILFSLLLIVFTFFILPALLSYIIERNISKESSTCTPPYNFKEKLIEIIQKQAKKKESWEGNYYSLRIRFPEKIGNITGPLYPSDFICHQGMYERENVNYLYCEGFVGFRWREVIIDEEGNILKRRVYQITLSKIILEKESLNVVDIELRCS